MPKQMPKIKPKGEMQITDNDIKKHAPDLIEKRHTMAEEIAFVHEIKPHLDKMMQKIADKTGTSMSSRVKDPKQIVRKVVQKRMEDREYQLSDVNDLLGFRFSFADDKKEPLVKKAIEEAAKTGEFQIIEEQARDKDTYHAYHFDVAFPITDGKSIRCEIQLMNFNAEGQAAVTHDAHFEFGDDVPHHVQKALDKQTKEVDSMPPIKAKKVADTLIEAHKRNDDNTLPPKYIKQTIQSAK